jgi:DNA processing protein
LQDRTALTTETLSAMLMMLELEGKVTTVAGNQYQRLI